MPEHGESSTFPWFRHYAEALWMVVKGRKGRHLFLTVLLATVTLVLLCSYSVSNLEPVTFSGLKGDELWRAEDDRRAHGTASAEAVSSPGPSPTDSTTTTTTNNDDAAAGAAATPSLEPLPFTAKNGPTFRLLIPAAESDANFCRSILSTMLLDYPPPTILGYSSKDQTATVVGSIYAHLADRHIRDDDLILVADGYRAWFQLPSSVLVRQYLRVTADANRRLEKTYGVRAAAGEQRFRQTVLFAADTHCWHYADDGDVDVACDAVPDAPGVWESANNGRKNASNIFNPKFLNSGIVMGPARDLRAVFAAASQKSTGAGGAHDLQHALQIMYSEQEQAREAVRRANLGPAGRVREWLYSTVYGQTNFLRGKRSASGGTAGTPMSRRRNLTITPGRAYEYGIGLDYGSALFQSMSAPHSFNGDVEFLAADDALAFPDPHMHTLPPALEALPSPFFLPPADKASEDIPDNATTPLTLTPGLDDLPADVPWSALPLARNLLTGAAPASTDTTTPPSFTHLDPRDSIYRHLWFAPYARALLRRHMRRTTFRSRRERELHADHRGGAGGVWTERGEWLAWGDVCRGVEEEVFGADGWGEWGVERQARGLFEDARRREMLERVEEEKRRRVVEKEEEERRRR
ncbi:hypothetical protein IWX50DRAFT_696550, partial [Phyllosticta citricarpa]